MSKSKKAAGEVRQSQVLSTFGPGSMVDLPNHAVLIGGLNHWQGYKNQPIYEDRLASRLAEILGVNRVPDGDFHARTRQLVGLPEALGSRIDRIVLVHRLREVIAQVGFTRFEPELPDIDGDLSLGVRRAALSLENNYLHITRVWLCRKFDSRAHLCWRLWLWHPPLYGFI